MAAGDVDHQSAVVLTAVASDALDPNDLRATIDWLAGSEARHQMQLSTLMLAILPESHYWLGELPVNDGRWKSRLQIVYSWPIAGALVAVLEADRLDVALDMARAYMKEHPLP